MKFNNYSSRTKAELEQRLLFLAWNSNINGLKHIVKSESILVKWLWVAVVLASAGCMAVLLTPAARDGAALSYNPDTRYLLWTTTFPAVTVCETFYATRAQRKFEANAQFGPMMKNLSYNYRRYLTNLLYGIGSCTKEVCIPCGSTVPCDLPWRQIMDNIYTSCPELLSECEFNGAAFPCCARFRRVDAEHGRCYSFNTLQHRNSTQESLLTVNRTTGPGLLSFRVHHDTEISVHSPEELSTNNLDNKFKFAVKTLEANWAEFLFSLVEMATDPLLKFEDTLVRGCRYLEDVPASLFTYPVYSYGACKLAESTKHSFSECGCVHPVRDLAYKEKYCNYTGLNCLVSYDANKNKLGIEQKKDDVTCLPSCDESELTTIHIGKKRVTDDNKEGATVNVRMSALPHLRYERHLVRSNLDLVVSLGGVIGLFFGASILSLVELLYLITRKP
ncbi:sodium channel protein Nach-like [Leguminivora glycinivorella]|uniref:sodium channel protein Nach-like n=1 Tax=Leguminivora glycinivorella TaxID=1035111 RepID=UPI0020106B58|nr:sodium channel protein Nach-like [Leguminivora glycinivorella]